MSAVRDSSAPRTDAGRDFPLAGWSLAVDRCARAHCRVILFLCIPMRENSHEADSARHFACFCCDRRAGRAGTAGFKHPCHQPQRAHGPRPVLLCGRWWPLLEFRHVARSSSTQPCQSASARSIRGARLPQWVVLSVSLVVPMPLRHAGIISRHRLLSNSASCRAINSAPDVGRLVSCHCGDILPMGPDRWFEETLQNIYGLAAAGPGDSHENICRNDVIPTMSANRSHLCICRTKVCSLSWWSG